MRPPRAGFDRVPAIVFACLIPGELRIVLHPGSGMADGGIPMNIPVEEIPFDLRTPNTPLFISFDQGWKILRVWRREE
jgi:hypothetical protein